MFIFLLRNFRRLWRIPAIIFHLFFQATMLVWEKFRYSSVPEKASAHLDLRIRKWAEGLLKILNIHCSTEGQFSGDHGRFMISNHQTYLDILVHASFGGIRFAPNSGIRSWPFFGWLVHLSDPVWIDRSSPGKAKETLEEFKKKVLRGNTLMLYPEGTTTDGKGNLLAFKSTVFEGAIELNQPIYPILTFYKEDSSAKDVPVAWADDKPFPLHVLGLLGNKQTDVKIYILPEIHPEKGISRKEFAAKARNVMNQEFVRRRNDIQWR